MGDLTHLRIQSNKFVFVMSKTSTEISSRVLELIDRLAEVMSNTDCSELKHAMNVLKGIRDVMSNSSTRVVILGKYGIGKSSFLNAMIGHPLLSTMLPPFYEAIWEMQYAQNPSATIYPAKYLGKEPFNVQIEDLEKYIFSGGGEMKDNAKEALVFEKIIIKYPFDTYKQDVVFVEVPGLDYKSNRYIYHLSADVIIYCMNTQHPFGTIDKNVIEQLRALGHRSIIFVLTFFDTVEYLDKMMGSHDTENICRHYTSILSPYTDLGSNGIFFISSLNALNGKMKEDMSLLESSNLPKLEKKLELILNEHGRLKLIKTIDSVGKANRELCRFLLDKIEFCLKDNALSLGCLISEHKMTHYISSLKECNAISEELASISNKLVKNICHKD